MAAPSKPRSRPCWTAGGLNWKTPLAGRMLTAAKVFCAGRAEIGQPSQHRDDLTPLASDRHRRQLALGQRNKGNAASCVVRVCRCLGRSAHGTDDLAKNHTWQHSRAIKRTRGATRVARLFREVGCKECLSCHDQQCVCSQLRMATGARSPAPKPRKVHTIASSSIEKRARAHRHDQP